MKFKELSKINFENIAIAENKYIDLNGVKIAYKDLGKGDCIFLIPPWPSSSDAYSPLMQLLSENFRVIALDLPGWAGCSSEMKQQPTILEYTKIIELFIKSFKIHKFHLLGYSFGGLICQSLINRKEIHPDKIVYVSTIHTGKDLQQEKSKLVTLYEFGKRININAEVIKLILKKIFLRSLEDGAVKYYNPEILNSSYFKYMVQEELKCNIINAIDSLESSFEYEGLHESLKKHKSIVIYSDSDPDFIKKGSYELAKYLEVEPFIIPAVDHNHLTFAPEKSYLIINNFLLSSLQKLILAFRNIV